MIAGRRWTSESRPARTAAPALAARHRSRTSRPGATSCCRRHRPTARSTASPTAGTAGCCRAPPPSISPSPRSVSPLTMMAVPSDSPIPRSFGNFWITGTRWSQRLRVLMCWSIAVPRRNLNASWWFGLRSHHHVGARRIPAHEILPLDRRARGAAGDHATALQHLVELPVGQRIRRRNRRCSTGVRR